MKNLFLCFFSFLNLACIAQIGVNTTNPSATLDIIAANPTGTSTTIDGILIPRLDRQRALSMTTIPNGTLIFVNSIATGTATGIASNITSVGFYAFDTTVLPAPGKWVQFQTTANGWSTSGNTGTNAATNYLGTTDPTDVVLRTNNTERLRINNAVGLTTGTAGDISIGDTNNGTIKSNRELVLRQDGDTFGSSVLRLRNRNGENGAIFENLNPTPAGTNLVDFVFRTGTTATPIQSNIRFETRSSSRKVTGTTTEFQIGQPDGVNGGPTLVVGANGTGTNSAFLLGNLGIGVANPTGKLHVLEATGTAPAGNAIGSLVIEHSNTGGQSSIVFPSAANRGSDYGYIRYQDDLSGNGSSTENSLLEIGVENDGIGTYQDDVALMPTGNVGIGTRAPKAKLHNNGTTAFTTATTGTNNTILLLNAGTFATPAASADNNGMVYIIRNTSTTANTTVNNIIDYNSGAAANFALTPTIGSIMIVSNGTSWFRIN